MTFYPLSTLRIRLHQIIDTGTRRGSDIWLPDCRLFHSIAFNPEIIFRVVRSFTPQTRPSSCRRLPSIFFPISGRFVASSGRCRMHCAITEDRQQRFPPTVYASLREYLHRLVSVSRHTRRHNCTHSIDELRIEIGPTGVWRRAG